MGRISDDQAAGLLPSTGADQLPFMSDVHLVERDLDLHEPVDHLGSTE